MRRQTASMDPQRAVEEPESKRRAREPERSQRAMHARSNGGASEMCQRAKEEPESNW